MPKRDWRLLLEDIIGCTQSIEKYIKGVEFDDFAQNQMLIDAVVRNLEIIGESAKWIPDEVKAKHSDVEWHKIVGLRNRVVHDYFDVDLGIIWFVIKNELAALRKKFQRVLEGED